MFFYLHTPTCSHHTPCTVFVPPLGLLPWVPTCPQACYCRQPFYNLPTYAYRLHHAETEFSTTHHTVLYSHYHTFTFPTPPTVWEVLLFGYPAVHYKSLPALIYYTHLPGLLDFYLLLLHHHLILQFFSVPTRFLSFCSVSPPHTWKTAFSTTCSLLFGCPLLGWFHPRCKFYWDMIFLHTCHSCSPFLPPPHMRSHTCHLPQFYLPSPHLPHLSSDS